MKNCGTRILLLICLALGYILVLAPMLNLFDQLSIPLTRETVLPIIGNTLLWLVVAILVLIVEFEYQFVSVPVPEPQEPDQTEQIESDQ